MSKSLAWWNKLTEDEKIWLLMKHGFETFNPEKVTTDQINKLHELETL